MKAIAVALPILIFLFAGFIVYFAIINKWAYQTVDVLIPSVGAITIALLLLCKQVYLDAPGDFSKKIPIRVIEYNDDLRIGVEGLLDTHPLAFNATDGLTTYSGMMMAYANDFLDRRKATESDINHDRFDFFEAVFWCWYSSHYGYGWIADVEKESLLFLEDGGAVSSGVPKEYTQQVSLLEAATGASYKNRWLEILSKGGCNFSLGIPKGTTFKYVAEPGIRKMTISSSSTNFTVEVGGGSIMNLKRWRQDHFVDLLHRGIIKHFGGITQSSNDLRSRSFHVKVEQSTDAMRRFSDQSKYEVKWGPELSSSIEKAFGWKELLQNLDVVLNGNLGRQL